MKWQILTGILWFAMVCGCGPDMKYRRLDAYLSNNQCGQATAFLDENADAYGSNSRLLYLLDTAMLNFHCGDQAAAQKNFDKAQKLAEKLWTESLSANALAMVTNDYLLPYAGEDFERVMIHLLAAMSYLKSDEQDEALVECRRLDSLLTLYNSKYEKKNVYKEDAFARYLSGILREADGNVDGAFIDYYKAYQIYKDYKEYYGTQPPPGLRADLMRLAVRVDRVADAEAVAGKRVANDPMTFEKAREMGRVVLIHLNGFAPEKKEDRIYLPSGGYGPITVAFPRMVVTPPGCLESRLVLTSARDSFNVKAALAEDINRIAVKNLDDRKLRILAKAAARAVAKQVVIHQIGNADTDKSRGDLIKIVLNILNVFVERADTRSWRTLPGEIRMASVFVPAGEYAVSAEACGNARNFRKINIDAGKVEFIIYDARYN